MERDEYADYVYMYPPRQAYRRLSATPSELARGVRDSLHREPRLNVYVHVPFCAQICRFCNLYTTAVHAEPVHRRYVDRLCAEIDTYAQSDLVPAGVTWSTVYFGGGTPSVLSPEQLSTVVDALASRLGCADYEELALEVSPETVDADYVRQLREVGFQRVSMGLQTTVPTELLSIGRRYPAGHRREVVEAALSAGFANVCLDLIFGLPGQTLESWSDSLQDVVELNPQTVCAYAWTSRPHTGYGKLGLARPDGTILRRMFRLADDVLTGAGYTRESHVRWVRGEGGYLQKKYHWGMRNLLGLGAGARSYLWDVDLRNGYSLARRTTALDKYLRADGFGWSGEPDGYWMSDDERRRKAVVLGVHDLDRAWYRRTFGVDPVELFGDTLDALRQRDLVDVSDARVRLTERGVAYRDLVVQLFFSPAARGLTESWTYDE